MEMIDMTNNELSARLLIEASNMLTKISNKHKYLCIDTDFYNTHSSYLIPIQYAGSIKDAARYLLQEFGDIENNKFILDRSLEKYRSTTRTYGIYEFTYRNDYEECMNSYGDVVHEVNKKYSKQLTTVTGFDGLCKLAGLTFEQRSKRAKFLHGPAIEFMQL
jgi:hypothetical protein